MYRYISIQVCTGISAHRYIQVYTGIPAHRYIQVYQHTGMYRYIQVYQHTGMHRYEGHPVAAAASLSVFLSVRQM